MTQIALPENIFRSIGSFFRQSILEFDSIVSFVVKPVNPLVVIVKHDMQLDRSVYEILQIISISLTDMTPLRDLFDKSNFNYFKEPSDSSEPNLFNF